MTLTPKGYKPRLIDSKIRRFLDAFGAVSVACSGWPRCRENTSRIDPGSTRTSRRTGTDRALCIDSQTVGRAGNRDLGIRLGSRLRTAKTRAKPMRKTRSLPVRIRVCVKSPSARARARRDGSRAAVQPGPCLRLFIIQPARPLTRTPTRTQAPSRNGRNGRKHRNKIPENSGLKSLKIPGYNS